MYDNYIAVDWAQTNMAIARMTGRSNKITVKDVPSDIKELQFYLSSLKGSKILTIEETTTSQWLYTELKDCVDLLLICDPYRNHLLKEGPKTDKIDATKLVQLLRANLLKPVFHSGDQFIYLRKIVSGYIDIVKAGVRQKNQRAALFRAAGKKKNETKLSGQAESFVLEGLDKGIKNYELEKERYEKLFESIYRKYQVVRNLKTIPGIGVIGAIKIAAIVVNANRFPDCAHYWSFCGLVDLQRISGGRSYGKKKPRYCRILKHVYNFAAISIIRGARSKNTLNQYYHYLINEKGYPAHHARTALRRKICTISLGILRSGKKFNPRRLKCSQTS